MDYQLEEYIASHSTAEDPLLEELFRQTHIKFVNPNMVSGHVQGKLLRFIALMLKPSEVLEIGTFTDTPLYAWLQPWNKTANCLQSR